jgi:hypothetical protein
MSPPASGSSEPDAGADEIADFVLRSLLARRSRLAAIRTAAHRANERSNRLVEN